MAILLSTTPQAKSTARITPERIAAYPRLRYMGSKYRVIPALLAVFSQLDFDTALDAFSGSGVVGYTLKALGKRVTANDFLNFPATVARAVIENPGEVLEADEVAQILGPNCDGRDFISATFDGLYFPDYDLAFLDSAWSHIDQLTGYKRDIAISALCLAAARKQPRGVFTVTDFRYNDGRRSMRTPLRDLFVEAVSEYNQTVIVDGPPATVLCSDIFAIRQTAFDLVYLDPPYAPPRDDNDYIKRYHFLEGLAVYWRGLSVMQDTLTKKLPKRYTPFGYRRTIVAALRQTFQMFADSTIVLSYSTNSLPAEAEVIDLLREVKDQVDVYAVEHRYSFGTHAAALRRQARELIFVGR